MTRLDKGDAMSLAIGISRAMREIDRLTARYGADRPTGTVIRFSKQFGTDLSYYYAGIRATDGLWYLTGHSVSVKTDGLEWEALLAFIDDGIASVDLEYWPPTLGGSLEPTSDSTATLGRPGPVRPPFDDEEV